VEEDELGGACGTCRGEEKCTQDFVGNRSVRDHDVIEMSLMKLDGKTWTGLIWLRVGTSVVRLF